MSEMGKHFVTNRHFCIIFWTSWCILQSNSYYLLYRSIVFCKIKRIYNWKFSKKYRVLLRDLQTVQNFCKSRKSWTIYPLLYLFWKFPIMDSSILQKQYLYSLNYKSYFIILTWNLRTYAKVSVSQKMFAQNQPRKLSYFKNSHKMAFQLITNLYMNYLKVNHNLSEGRK